VVTPCSIAVPAPKVNTNVEPPIGAGQEFTTPPPHPTSGAFLPRGSSARRAEGGSSSGVRHSRVEAVAEGGLARDAYLCQIALAKCRVRATDCDHIIALEDGGAPFDPRNCRAASRRSIPNARM